MVVDYYVYLVDILEFSHVNYTQGGEIIASSDGEGTITSTHVSLQTQAEYWDCAERKAARRRCRALELRVQHAEAHAEQLVAENSDPALVDSAILTAHRVRAELNANTCLHAAGLTGDTRPPLEVIP